MNLRQMCRIREHFVGAEIINLIARNLDIHGFCMYRGFIYVDEYVVPARIQAWSAYKTTNVDFPLIRL